MSGIAEWPLMFQEGEERKCLDRLHDGLRGGELELREVKKRERGVETDGAADDMPV